MLGFHVNKTSNWNGQRSRTISEALGDVSEANKIMGKTSFNCAQIFICGPQNSHYSIVDSDIENIRGGNIPVVVHGAYVDNPWNDISNTANIKKELSIVNKFEDRGLGVVVHLAKNTNNTLEKVITELTDNKDKPGRLYLEINAIKPGNHSFETPAKINDLFARIYDMDLRGLEVGLCVDTAHLASCGVVLGSINSAAEWFSQLQTKFNGEAPPQLIHFNDSATEPGAGKDTHAALFDGVIWSDYRNKPEQSGAAFVYNWAQKNKIPTILERSNSKMLLTDFKALERLI